MRVREAKTRAVADRPILVFACGNPSRGDDALGPRLIERLEQKQERGGLKRVELLTDFQLQIEHALDLLGRERVIFVDAAAGGRGPFSFARVAPEEEAGFTTHAMSPGAVLRVFRQVRGQEPPPAWLLAVRGYIFDLGRGLSPGAAANLRAAEAHLLGLILDR